MLLMLVLLLLVLLLLLLLFLRSCSYGCCSLLLAVACYSLAFVV